MGGGGGGAGMRTPTIELMPAKRSIVLRLVAAADVPSSTALILRIVIAALTTGSVKSTPAVTALLLLYMQPNGNGAPAVTFRQGSVGGGGAGVCCSRRPPGGSVALTGELHPMDTF